MNAYRDSIAAGLGLILGGLAIVCVTDTDLYSLPASVEARGNRALFEQSFSNRMPPVEFVRHHFHRPSSALNARGDSLMH